MTGRKMKYLILFLALMSIPLIAQVKSNNDKTEINAQTKEWMTKISSDSELRSMMMAMLLDKTTGNKIEMTKLGRSIMDNPEMNSIVSSMVDQKTSINDVTPKALSMMGDSTKPMKMSGYKMNHKK